MRCSPVVIGAGPQAEDRRRVDALSAALQLEEMGAVGDAGAADDADALGGGDAGAALGQRRADGAEMGVEGGDVAVADRHRQAARAAAADGEHLAVGDGHDGAAGGRAGRCRLRRRRARAGRWRGGGRRGR
jgi:hypothetical protein